MEATSPGKAAERGVGRCKRQQAGMAVAGAGGGLRAQLCGAGVAAGEQLPPQSLRVAEGVTTRLGITAKIYSTS